MGAGLKGAHRHPQSSAPHPKQKRRKAPASPAPSWTGSRPGWRHERGSQPGSRSGSFPRRRSRNISPRTRSTKGGRNTDVERALRTKKSSGLQEQRRGSSRVGYRHRAPLFFFPLPAAGAAGMSPETTWERTPIMEIKTTNTIRLMAPNTYSFQAATLLALHLVRRPARKRRGEVRGPSAVQTPGSRAQRGLALPTPWG